MKKKVKKMIRIMKCLGLKMQYDYLPSFSAHVALFMLMSLFPMAMFLTTFVKKLPFQVDRIGIYVEQYMPESIRPLAEQIIREVYTAKRGSLTVITFVVTIFCASKGFYAIRQGLNAVYGIRESRNFIMQYLIAGIYVIVFVLMLVMTFAIVVLGEGLVDVLILVLPQILQFERLIHAGRFLVMFFILLVFFLVMYINIPNRMSCVQYELPGALFTTFGWIFFSMVFSYYISHLANYSVTYGSLATLIVFMVWLYSSMYILFLGAECNVILQKYRECGCEIEIVLDYYMKAYEFDEIIDEHLQSINSKFDFVRSIIEKK